MIKIFLFSYMVALTALTGCAPRLEPDGQLTWSLNLEGIQPPDEPMYAKTPPCEHGGMQVVKLQMLEPCTRKNPAHVSFWTSRPDTYKQACNDKNNSYCDKKAVALGLVAHCHGFGEWRFCHAHPGGSESHDHIH